MSEFFPTRYVRMCHVFVTRTTARSERLILFRPNKTRTEKYMKNVLQLTLYDIELENHSIRNNTAAEHVAHKPKTECSACKKSFVTVQLHYAKSSCLKTLTRQ